MLLAVTVFSQTTEQGAPLLFLGGKAAGACCWPLTLMRKPISLPALCLHGFLGSGNEPYVFSIDYPSDEGIAGVTRPQMYCSVVDNRLIFFRPWTFLSVLCTWPCHCTCLLLSSAKVTVCEISKLLQDGLVQRLGHRVCTEDIAVRFPVGAHIFSAKCEVRFLEAIGLLFSA